MTQHKITEQQLVYLSNIKDHDAYTREWSKIIHRTPEMQARYDQDRASLKLQGIGLFQQIYNELSVEQGTDFTAISDNKYAYNIVDNLLHRVFWTSANVSIAEAVKQIKSSTSRVVAVLEAPETHKSIPEIKHYHFFVDSTM